MSASGDEDSLLQFPCDFPIKIMGSRTDDFARLMVDIVLRHAPDFAAESVEMRASSGGKYLALTCTIRATSRQQLDDLYRELTGHPLVKVVL
jgi:putative lipoic acid-binding regulatory protein